jgi:hypothetical protein
MSKLWKNKILFFEFYFFTVHLQRVLYALKGKGSQEIIVNSPDLFGEDLIDAAMAVWFHIQCKISRQVST